MDLLFIGHNDNSSDFEICDPTGKFNSDMKIKDFRCYTNDCINTKGNWKFKNYKTNHDNSGTFINNNSNHKANECDILVCKDKYIEYEDSEKKNVSYKNNKTTWWIGYKY